MGKQTLYIDLDEVCTQFISHLCSQYNNKYNKNLKVSDIKTYNLLQYIGEEGIQLIKEKGFFANLKPIYKSIETIEKLILDGHTVFIISSPMNEHSVFEKFLWIKQYLPFFNIKNLILVGNKGELLSKINGENSILFDDCPAYLREFNGIRIVMDREYNKELIVGDSVNDVNSVDYRVSGWNEFYEIVSGLELNN